MSLTDIGGSVCQVGTSVLSGSESALWSAGAHVAGVIVFEAWRVKCSPHISGLLKSFRAHVNVLCEPHQVALICRDKQKRF
jgi:hypothetical protein